MNLFGRRAAACVVAVASIAGCDTGDGKTLREPTGTLPPPTTTAPEGDEDGGLESIPFQEDLEASEEFDDGGVFDDGDAFDLQAPWVDGAPIDSRYTCDGLDATPALSWAAAPLDAAELAIVMIDELSPDNVNGVHWVMAGLDPATTRLVEDEVPLGAVQGINSFGELGWTGPCPDPGTGQQTYRFTVYALGQQSEISDGTPAGDAIAFIEAVAFSSSDILATYER